MKASKRGEGLCVELAINIFGVMSAYWVSCLRRRAPAHQALTVFTYRSIMA